VASTKLNTGGSSLDTLSTIGYRQTVSALAQERSSAVSHSGRAYLHSDSSYRQWSPRCRSLRPNNGSSIASKMTNASRARCNLFVWDRWGRA